MRNVLVGLGMVLLGCVVGSIAVFIWKCTDNIQIGKWVVWKQQSFGFARWTVFADYLLRSPWWWLFLVAMFAMGFALSAFHFNRIQPT